MEDRYLFSRRGVETGILKCLERWKVREGEFNFLRLMEVLNMKETEDEISCLMLSSEYQKILIAPSLTLTVTNLTA